MDSRWRRRIRSASIRLTAFWLAALPVLGAASATPARADGGAPPAIPGGSSTSTITRVYGESRQATALALAEQAFPQGVPSGTAILTAGRNRDLVDALTAGPLAAALHVPILLTRSAHTPGRTLTAGLAALHVDRVILVGSTANPTLEARLPAGVTVAAVYRGSSRFRTAAKVAAALAAAEGVSRFGQVFLTSADQDHLVDALSAGPAAAHLGVPILLLPRGEERVSALPTSEQAWVYGASTAYVIGAAGRYRLKGLSPGTRVVRIAGPSRFATALAIDQRFFPHPSTVFIANGSEDHLVDALTATPWAARLDAPLLLVNDGRVTPSGRSYLQELAASAVQYVVIGGPASIPSTVTREVERTDHARREHEHHHPEQEPGDNTGDSGDSSDSGDGGGS
ncbi:MAG: cell wall-binding repeat-containing protein [Firmicutes bacterium]|nr:cell wall-binding repeat-containing protein [Bacillota bacterium]